MKDTTKKGSAVVEFATEESARRGAAALSGLRLWNHTLAAVGLPANTEAIRIPQQATQEEESPTARRSRPMPLVAPAVTTALRVPTSPGHFRAMGGTPFAGVQQHRQASAMPRPWEHHGSASPSDGLSVSSNEGDDLSYTTAYACEQGSGCGSDQACSPSRPNAVLQQQPSFPSIDVNIVANIVRALSEVPQCVCQQRDSA